MSNVEIDNKNTTIIILVGLDLRTNSPLLIHPGQVFLLKCYQHFYLARQVHAYQQQPAWEQTASGNTWRKTQHKTTIINFAYISL